MKYYIISCFTVFYFSVAAQNLAPKSGLPLMSGTADGIGRFALPSLTGAVMGMALVNEDQEPDLFLQADMRKPGTYLYHFRKFTTAGVPVFSQGTKIKLPFSTEEEPRGIIFETKKRQIYGLWRAPKAISIANFNRKTLEFENLKTIQVKNLPSQYSTMGIVALPSGKLLVLFTLAQPGVYTDNDKNADNLYYTPEGMWPYELPTVGIYGALIADLESTTSINPVPLTGLNEAYFGINGYTGYQQHILAGTRLGNILVYQPGGAGTFLPKKYLVDTVGNLIRNPVVNNFLTYFKGSSPTEGVITSGEGGIYFYANKQKSDARGNWVFAGPVELLQETPELHAGSLVVPELVDWDGDGLIDLIVGNSAGRIYFIKNRGTNQIPAFDLPVPLKADGAEIHIQPGYREDIQGPGESRWGYVCPAVIDWNNDGLLDILTGDSRGKFMVFLNIGTKTQPLLAKEHTLYHNGMDLHGGWRSRPGVAQLGEKMAYIITDRDNEFHLYWQLDKYNLTDGGKLTIGDSVAIKAHRRQGGQVGRAKTHVVDWDGDGVKDLLIGTGRGAAIPNPINGLPYHRKVKNEGAAVLFLKNTASNEKPVFAFPKMMKFKGKDILLGAHECGPTTAMIGGDGRTLNLVVGNEFGNFIFYDRKDLSWE